MGLGNIRFGGLGSGLDTNAIVQALLSIEQAKIGVLQSEQQGYRNKISLFSNLRGLTATLQDKAQEFSETDSTILGYEVTASDTGYATFTVTGAPAAGSHELSVTQLAQADKYSLSQASTITDADTSLSSGTISFDYDGTSYSISGTYTLNELAAEINTQAGDDVSASVVNVGTENSPDYQLILAGNDTGEDFDIQNLSVGIAELDTTTSLATAQNAQVTIDNLQVERSTNEFEDVIEGVTFRVQALTTSNLTVDVGLDSEATKENVRELIDAYNKTIQFINGQNAYSEETGTGGALFGDSALRTVRSALHQALFDRDTTTVANDPDGYSTLGLVGLELQSDGTIQLDESTFDEKLADDAGQLEDLFKDPSTGVLVKLDDAIDILLNGPGSDDVSGESAGVFGNRKNTLQSSIDRLGDDITRLQDRLEKTEETLVLKFANLEGLMSNLQQQQAYLSQGLG